MHSHDSPQHDASERPKSSVLSEALRLLTRLSARNPKIVLCLVLLSSCAAAGYTASCLEFRTERSDLIDPEADFQQRWKSYTETFGEGSDMVVVVEGQEPAQIKPVLDELGSQLLREPELFTNVLYKVNTRALRSKALQYFRPEQLASGLERLTDYRAVAQGRWEAARLDYALYVVGGRLRNAAARREENPQTYAVMQAGQIARSLNGFLEQPNQFQSPWIEIIPGSRQLEPPTENVTYFLNDQGTMGFLKAMPVAKVKDDFNGYTPTVDRLRELIAQVSAQHPNVTIGVTGIPVLENDEMRRSQSDMMLASVLSFVGVALVLFVGFRGFRHPLLGLLMLLAGMAWTFGYTTLVVGHLNILSVSFAVILIGLGIDFTIHYIARYLELRHQGQSLRPALRETSSSVGPGIVTAALTTALAFFCATLTQFLGVAELGIIAGGGILLCCLATFVVLPALIALSDRDVEPRKLPTPFDGHVLRSLTSRFPRLVTCLSLGLVLALSAQAIDWTAEGGPASRVRYDSNLLNLQADGLDSVEVQKRVFSQSEDSLLFAVSIADSPAEARRLKAQFEALPTVRRVEDLASRLPDASAETTQLYVQSYRSQLTRLAVPPTQPPLLNPAAIGRGLEELLLVLRGTRTPEAIEASQGIDRFLDRFEALSLRSQTEFLSGFQVRATYALYRELEALAAGSSSAPLTLADMPRELTNRFVSPEGQWLLQVYPKNQIWDAEPLAQFVQEVRTVDPNVTGTPLQNFEASRQIRDSYQTASVYAFAMICFVLLVDFLGREHKLLVLGPPLVVVVFTAMLLQARRIEVSPLWLIGSYVLMTTAIAAILDFRNLRDALLAMSPPAIGGLLMFGLMGLFRLDLNPANLIVLPLILGIGVDDGVHVVHDFRAQRGRYRPASSTINAIVQTSLTTMVGFGSMLVAAHRGLSSVGLVLVIGVGCCLFVSLVTLPALLTFLSDRKLSQGEVEDSTGTKPDSRDKSAFDSSSGSAGQRSKRRAA